MKSKLILTILCTMTMMLAVPSAQTPRLANARQTTRSAAAGLTRVLNEIVGAADGVTWVGYAVPAVDDDRSRCCDSCQSAGNGCCGEYTLEGGSRHVKAGPAGPAAGRNGTPPTARLDATDQALVFLRIEHHAIEKVRVFSDDCPIDGSGLPVVWLTDVQPAESLSFLKSLALSRFTAEAGHEGEGSPRGISNGAILAVAMHRGDQADDVLADLAAPTRPDGLRKQVTFWMGAARGHRGFEALVRILREDPSERVRDAAVFGLSVSHDPEAVEAIIAAARTDRSTHVRGQALFWLSQKASKKAAEAITDAIEQDPETDVKKKAVFALSQLPPETGVPLLIKVATQNANPAVRKQAMFWLGQSNDPRALEFFEAVLR